MHSIKTASISSLALALAACGGGGTSGGGGPVITPGPAPTATPTPSPTPTPTPSPAPTPTPTPSPTPTPVPTAPNTSVQPPLETGTFATQADITAVTYDRGAAQASTKGDGSQVTISYDAADNAYVIGVGPQNYRFLPGDALPSAGNFAFANSANGEERNLLLSTGDQGLIEPRPEYVREGLFYTSTYNAIDDEREYTASSFVFGLPSDVADIAPRGRAAHFITLRGALSGSSAQGAPYDTLSLLGGVGSIQVDFATGKVTIAANTSVSNTQGQSRDEANAGTLSGTADLASGENLFTGSFTANHTDGAGALVFNGDWSGRFYGPDADEVGGTLYATSGDYFYSASFAGREYDAVLPGETLANLTGVTRFRTSRNANLFPEAGGIDSLLSEYFLTYDAATQRWEVGTSQFTIGFGPGNRVSAQDANDLLAYRATQPVAGGGEVQYDIGLFDGSSQGVALTYTSFARVIGARLDAGGAVEATSLDWIAFGIATPLDQISLTGSASYTGRTAGTLRQGSDILAEFGGTSLLRVNCGDQTLTVRIAPSGVDAGGMPIAYGIYDFAGALSAVTGEIEADLNGGNGALLGRFFGDAAQEYGATFRIEDAGLGTLDGVSFGKRD